MNFKLKRSYPQVSKRFPPFLKGDTGGFGALTYRNQAPKGGRGLFASFRLCASLVILGVLFCTGSVQADARGSEVIEKMQKKFSDLKTLSAQFVKRHYWRLMEQHQEVKGRLLVQRPNRFRFDSDAQVVVTDGETAWNYAPANGQVMLSDYATVKNDRSYEKLLFDLILLGGYDKRYAPKYVAEEKINRKTCHVVDLSANKEDTYVHNIRLWVDKRLWLVRQVEYRNIHDDVTTFVLSDLKVDKKLKENQFTFHAPKGVEVIDLR
jgi:chaperone LolA